MEPIYPYIAVDKIDDDKSSLVQTIEEHPVVKIIGLPSTIPYDDSPVTLALGQKILVNHVDEYMVYGERLYFVRIKDIVSIV